MSKPRFVNKTRENWGLTKCKAEAIYLKIDWGAKQVVQLHMIMLFRTQTEKDKTKKIGKGKDMDTQAAGIAGELKVNAKSLVIKKKKK